MFHQVPYQDMYQRKIDPTPIEYYAKFDAEWGVYYIEDFRCIDKFSAHIMRETNLKFLKILKACGIFVIDQQNHLWWKQVIYIDDIHRIIATIENCYRSGWFYDSDLHDDIFEHFDIVSPYILSDRTRYESFIQKNQYLFANLKECELFIRDRCRLFCLYVLLRRCAILARDHNYGTPLQLLLNFLAIKKNLDLFKEQELRVKPVLFAGDYWGTGLHEWLTCHSTLLALKRTAGQENAEPCIKPLEGKLSCQGQPEIPFVFSEFNWLDFQFLVRTGTRHMVYPNLNGHPGAVYASIVPARKRATKGEGQQTVFDQRFHHLINEKFNQSRSIGQFMTEVAYLYEKNVLHDRTTNFYLTTSPYYFSNGLTTNNYWHVYFFQQQELKEPHENIHIWYREILTHVDLTQLENNDRIIYTYSHDKIIPTFKNIEKAVPPTAPRLILY